MNVGVLAFVIAAVGLFLALIVAIVVVLWLIWRSRPGHAAVPAGGVADGSVLEGIVRTIVVTTVPRSPARRQDDNDQRRVTVLIDVDGPAGPGRIADAPEWPKYLPAVLGWRVFTRNPFRFGDRLVNRGMRDLYS